MRSRTWVWVTVAVILAVVLVGIGAAALVRPSSTPSNTEPQPLPSPSSSLTLGVFEFREVFSQEAGGIQGKPPISPGPAKGGEPTTGDLLRTDCNLTPRPTEHNDKVMLCGENGVRYGLGPSALPASPVDSAQAYQAPDGHWYVLVQFKDVAAKALTEFTRRLSALEPPLNQAAIVIDGVVVNAPAINNVITTDTLVIPGPFSQEDAQALAASITP